jgi:hypothetical protein
MLERMAQSEMLKLFTTPKDDGEPSKSNESISKAQTPAIETAAPSSIAPPGLSAAEKLPSVDNAVEQPNDKKQS